MKPIRILMQEHRLIEQVLGCLESMADRCAAGATLDVEPAREAIDFFREFADRCHHAKEEDLLFPEMERRGFPSDAGPVAVMRSEHVRGRELIQGMVAAIDAVSAGEAPATERFVDCARGYVALLREHIRKEDHCLFPMAEQALDAAGLSELGRRFDAVETSQFGPEVHERYRAVANALADRYGVPQCEPTTDE